MTDVDRDDDKMRSAVAAAIRMQPLATDEDEAWQIVQASIRARRLRRRRWAGAMATVAAAAATCVALIWWGQSPGDLPSYGQLGPNQPGLGQPHAGQEVVGGDPPVPQVRAWADIDADQLDRIKAGDIVKGMTVKSIEPFSERMPLGEVNVRIVFSGRLTVRGQYTHHGPGGLTPDAVSFQVHAEAAQALPQLGGRTPWFFFSNEAEAKEQFGPPGSRGEATVVIDGYVIERYQGHNAFDRAELIEVLAAEPLPDPEGKR